MKISFLLNLICLVAISSSSFSQSGSFTLTIENAKVKEILKTIESQSPYRFFYNDQLSDVNRIVNVSVNQSNIQDLLTQIFEKTDVTFTVLENDLIVVGPKKALQQQKLTGTITDATNGEPVIGANVVVEGTTMGVITDINGKFSLDVASTNLVLVISYIGYNTEKVAVNGTANIDVKLIPDIKNLEEIVVVGYGQQKKVNLTGAVASISSKDLAGIPVTNTGQLLSGRVSGVNIAAQSARPGDDNVRIRIRGYGSLSSENDPLVLIDGVEGNIADIDPNQIESVSILKDAAAGAIYGIRAANGVVLVTTKKGKAGKMNIDYVYNYSQQEVMKKVELLNAKEYATLRDAANQRAGLSRLFTDDELNNMGEGSDWLDGIMQVAPMVSHNLSVSGGNEQTTYSVSVGSVSQEGIIKGSSSQKYTFRSNVESKINKIFTFSSIIGYSRRMEDSKQWNTTGSIAGDGANEMLKNAYRLPPTMPIYNSDGTYAHAVKNSLTEQSDLINPLWILDQGFINEDYNNRFDGMLSLEANIWKGIKFKSSFGGTMTFRDEKYYSPLATAYYREKNADGLWVQSAPIPTNACRSVTPSQLRMRYSKSITPLWTNLLTYGNKFGKHTVSGLAGYEVRWNDSYNNDQIKQNYLTNDFERLSLGGDPPYRLTDGGGSWSSLSYLGRVNYAFADKYLFEANLRYDGTSKFPNDPWGLFPSFSAGWRVSEENFLKNSAPFIDNLKIRFSWGKVGNDAVGDYEGVSELNPTSYYVFNGAKVMGTRVSRFANENLTWEITTTTDIGLDLALLKNRLNLTLDYYVRTTDGMLADQSIPTSAGIPAPKKNLGQMINKGIEASLGFNDDIGDFSYGLNAQFAYNHNELTEYDLQGKKYVTLGETGVRMVGEPAFAIWGWKTDGIFQTPEEVSAYPVRAGTTPGDLKIVDLNGDDKITEDDKTILGDVIPKINYGLMLNAAYKGFDFNVQFQGILGRDRVLTNYGMAISNVKQNLYKFWKDSWTGPGTSQTIPVVTTGKSTSVNNRAVMTDFLVQDASFLRVKIAQIGYTIPKSLIGKTKVLDNLRVYVSASNLYTWTEYPGFDPELGSEDHSQSEGLEYPTPRIITFGINASF